MPATGGERLKLLGSITSPFVRKVRVVAMELGLGDRIDLVPTETSDPALGLSTPLARCRRCCWPMARRFMTVR